MMIRSLIALLLVTVFAIPALAETPAELAQAGRYEEAISAYRQAAAQTTDALAKGQLLKELGDLYVSHEDYHSAGPEYREALALNGSFSHGERLKMSIAMAWGDMTHDAEEELRRLLDEQPEDTAVRVNLARVLSWEGDQNEAIRQADTVLASDPENRDALLIKANALRWSGKPRTAIPLYQKHLSGEDNFDARVGLGYAQLATGKVGEAKATGLALSPRYPYQERELTKFRTALENRHRHNFTAGYDYYNDTDNNSVNRYRATYSLSLDAVTLGAVFLHDKARDMSRNNSAQEYMMTVASRPADGIGLEGGFGFSNLHPQDSGEAFLPVGYLSGNLQLLKGSLGITLSRTSFTEIAQLIENRIKVNTASISLSQDLTDRLSVSAAYRFQHFSDHNLSNNVQATASYRLYSGTPTITTGYRVRYLNFDHQAGDGYFDPNNFLSNQLYLAFRLVKGDFTGNIEGYGGYQIFRRNNAHASDWFGGVTGSLDYRINRYLDLEAHGEFGNYAVQTVSGFEYYLVGGRLNIGF